MSVDMQFKKFSQSLYGAIVALDVLNCNKHDLVDTSALEKSISNILSKPSKLGFDSGVSPRGLKKNSIRLEGEDATQIVELTSQCLINIYFIHLVTILEVSICEKFGVDTGKLKNSIDSLRVDSSREWAKKAVHQMRCIRNVLIHANGKWNKDTLQEIKAYVPGSIAISPGTEVLLSFEDLIRYRRAVRTFVNSATK